MLVSIFAFLFVFTVVVLVHELGHFLAAKRAGVKIYEFSIGFPFSLKIATLFRHRETDFTLRLLPLGGFVSFSKDDQDGEIVNLFLTSRANRALILAAGSLFNIFFAFLVFFAVFSIGRQLPLIESVELSVKTVWSVIAGSAIFLFNLFSGSGGTDSLVGPVGIALYAGKAAAAGFLNLAYFTGMLSLSLGIMNLVPLPALDGGQLLMLMIEIPKRKPLSLKTYQAVNVAGMAVFLVLTILVTYRDVARLFT
jgi:regulator of sigma E protease